MTTCPQARDSRAGCLPHWCALHLTAPAAHQLCTPLPWLLEQPMIHPIHIVHATSGIQVDCLWTWWTIHCKRAAIRKVLLHLPQGSGESTSYPVLILPCPCLIPPCPCLIPPATCHSQKAARPLFQLMRTFTRKSSTMKMPAGFCFQLSAWLTNFHSQLMCGCTIGPLNYLRGLHTCCLVTSWHGLHTLPTGQQFHLFWKQYWLHEHKSAQVTELRSEPCFSVPSFTPSPWSNQLS